MGLRDIFKRFMTEYRAIFDEVWRTGIFTNEFGDFVRHDIAGMLKQIAGGVDSVYTSKGSVGQTKWTPVPWVAIFDSRITRKATEGEYIVYLLNSETRELYLTFNQASEGKNNSGVRKNLKEKAIRIREQLEFPEKVSLDQISSGNTAYDAGCICSIKYSLGNLPDDNELIEDLLLFLEIYSKYYTKVYIENNRAGEWWPKKEEYIPGLSKEDWISILGNPKYVTNNLRRVLACYYDIGGQASVLQLVQKYGETDNFYKMTCMNLAKKLIEDQKCLEPKMGENSRRWPVLFLGRKTKKDEIGDYIWKLRPELEEALTEMNILQYLEERGEEPLSTKEMLEHINAYITAKGFTFEEGLIENFYLSLKSKPFVILAGTSGTGKTRLVRLFAEAIGATSDNGRYKLVSVRPDWSDSSDLFGHVDLNNKFVPGAIIDFINQAEWDSTNPYFLCLDEMNLARVEYYFSDVLSIIETREYKDGTITTDPLVAENYYGVDTEALEKYGVVRIPENLYIIGTVNMDETTFPFSRKVLDRANTIEFSTVNFLSGFDTPFNGVHPINVGNDFMRADYIFFQQCAHEREYVNKLCVELQEINKILEKANAHVGYRVRDEITFYMLNNKNAELLSRDEAFDNEIMQKVLPRIQGSSTAVKTMLCELFKHCADEYESYQTESDDISSKMFKAAQKPECKYRKSAEKIAFMVRRFEEDGFTAYWL